MRYLFSLILLVSFFVVPGVINAKYDPLSVPNNPFGIHILEPSDVFDAANLVNSAGGDWGYVTLVIREDDRDLGKWQGVFDQMRRLHLVPIVRIATHIDGDSWVRPYHDSAKDWAKFLNTLIWPIENKYVVLFNEPNHANEWGRVLDPSGFANTMMEYAHALRKESSDFFILPPGLDFSATTDGRSMDASSFLTLMLAAQPTMFDYLDGWTSHSYPNPAFSGSPYAVGRGTIRSFLWELQLLRNLGVSKKLPIFITETGWVHSHGVYTNTGLLSPEQVARNVRIAAELVWQSDDIVAVTPFVLNYQGLPFDHFSWRKLGKSDFYPQYESYKSIPKKQADPRQYQRYSFDKRLMPQTLVAGSTYELTALLKNEGQAILSQQDGYDISLKTKTPFVQIVEPIADMEPGQFGSISLHIETPNIPSNYPYSIDVTKGNYSTQVESGEINLVSPPSIEFDIQLGWKPVSTTTQATILIYDHHTPIHKINGVEVRNGKAVIEDLRNIVPTYPYRIVVLVPYYLPRQIITALKRDRTHIQFKRMYPLDFNKDGMLSPADLLALIRLRPNFVHSLFFGR